MQHTDDGNEEEMMNTALFGTIVTSGIISFLLFSLVATCLVCSVIKNRHDKKRVAEHLSLSVPSTETPALTNNEVRLFS